MPRYFLIAMLLQVTSLAAEPLKFRTVKLFENTAQRGQYWACDPSNLNSALVERSSDGSIQVHESHFAPEWQVGSEENLRLPDGRVFFYPASPHSGDVLTNVHSASLISPGVGVEVLREIPADRQSLRNLGYDIEVQHIPGTETPVPANTQIVWVVIPYDASQAEAVRIFRNSYRELQDDTHPIRDDVGGVLRGWMDSKDAETILASAERDLKRRGHVYRSLLDASAPDSPDLVPSPELQLNGFARSLKFSRWLNLADHSEPNIVESIASEIFYLEQFSQHLLSVHNLFLRPTPASVREDYIRNFSGAAELLVGKALAKLHKLRTEGATEALLFAGFSARHRAVSARLPYLLLQAYDGRTYFTHWLERLTGYVTWPLSHEQEEWPYDPDNLMGKVLWLPVSLALSDPSPRSQKSPYYSPKDETWGVLALGLRRNAATIDQLFQAILEMDQASQQIQFKLRESDSSTRGGSHILERIIGALRWAPEYLDRFSSLDTKFSRTLFVEQSAILMTKLLSSAHWHKLSAASYLALVQAASGLARDERFAQGRGRPAAMAALVHMQTALNTRLLRSAFLSRDGCASMLEAK